MEQFATVIAFPDGTCARTYVISGTQIVPEGVKVHGTGFTITTIEVDNYEDRERVTRLIKECIDKGKRAKQPDWSFLYEKQNNPEKQK